MSDKCGCGRRRVTEFVDHSKEYGPHFNHRSHSLKNRFKWKMDFLKVGQTGSRAVGGKRPHNEDLYQLRSSVVVVCARTTRDKQRQSFADNPAGF